jgi:hypothetical protein
VLPALEHQAAEVFAAAVAGQEPGARKKKKKV